MTTDAAAQSVASRIMMFTPSKEEFKDFSRYIAYMESQGAHRAGMAKVIPPKGWKPRRTYDDIDELVIPAPIQQVVTGQSGLFTQYNIQKKPMTVHEFRKTSNMDKFCNPRYADFEELERKFWKNLTFNPPLYGADVSGTLYDADVTEWNIGRLNTILDTVESESGIKIKGVNTPYLYFGMWKSAFAWHTEDMDLYSINYLHFGEPKSWYVVPPEHGKRLERLAKGFFPGNAQSCEAFLRHKMTLISPSILKKYGIPFEKVTQEAGQFIVTFPFGYHAGFNHGFNCAESTNFATQRWIDYGKQATLCSCRQDMVKISMDVFVRKFQPDRYKLWKSGKDNAPIDHARATPEAAEFLREKEPPAQTSSGPGESTLQVQEDSRSRSLSSGRTVSGLKSPCPSPKPHAGTKRPLDVTEDPEHSVEETEEVQKKKAKLSEEEEEEKKKAKLSEEEEEKKKAKLSEEEDETEEEMEEEKKKAKLLEEVTEEEEKKKKAKLLEEVMEEEEMEEEKKKAKLSEEETEEEEKKKAKLLKEVMEEEEKKKAKLSEEETEEEEEEEQPVTDVLVQTHQDPVKLEPKKEKETKTQTKAGAKKTPSRHGVSRKDKNGVTGTTGTTGTTADGVSPEPQTVSAEDDQQPSSNFTPAHRMFQRTLSPADVLHVHSYAKGDYGDNDITKEDRRSEDRRSEDRRSEDRRSEDRRSDGSEDEDTKEDVRHTQVELEEAAGGDLGQLPGHHPLIKDGLSDEETPEEPPPLEEGGLEGESWAKPLAHLWQSRPPNLKRERLYNQRVGSAPPYCSICSLFHTYQQTECGARLDSPVMVGGGRMRTKPLIPETCFTTTTEEESECEEQPLTPHLEEDGTSLLISCSQCSIRVHTSCYGIDPASVSKEWKCARCKANAMTENCCLCSLRGGALQKANNNKWVHVLCAVAVLEARFVNITERSPVDLSGIPLQRFKLKCYYCKKRMKKASGCCVQCSHGRCPTAYHPTCAQAAGVLMQPDDWPFVVHVTCCRHKGPAQIERNKAAMQELTVGQKVICKHKNGRYYQCDVVQLSKETFYEVNFDDGSFSDNLFPEDIVSRDCAQLGPPAQGDVVQVRWTDGLVYGAKFVASHAVHMYLVEFEDGSQLTAKRDDVYSLDEELPKRVKSRLSKASDMRFDGIFEEKEIIKASKRQRVINSRYRGDYIEPVIYRAIME